MEPVSLDLGLQGTHIMVTGGAGHIGTATVAAFLAAGANVTCADLEIDITARLGRELHVRHFSQLYALRLDVTNESEVAQAFGLARKRFGAVRGVVGLAGLDLSVLLAERKELGPDSGRGDGLAELQLDAWKRTLDVNLTGSFLVAREWLRGLKDVDAAQGGNVSLVLVGSESGSFGERANADYAASKSAVQGGLLQSLKADAPRVCEGARVNAIAPGPVDTPRFREECVEDPAQYYLDAQGTVALRRPVSIEQVARSIVYLASDAFSGGVHGQVLSVNSGKEGKIMWERSEVR